MECTGKMLRFAKVRMPFCSSLYILMKLESMKPILTIEYCPRCGWLLRSAWLAQELLTTFWEELGEVGLRPAEISGTFKIYLNGQEIFDRKQAGGFPEIKTLKQQVRDLIAPEKSLGHSDRKME